MAWSIGLRRVVMEVDDSMAVAESILKQDKEASVNSALISKI